MGLDARGLPPGPAEGLPVTNVRAPELYEPKVAKRHRRHEAYLRAHQGVDPAIMAIELGISEVSVRTAQRKLGLRGCRNPRSAEA